MPGVAVLGSTGSIGRNTLDVLQHLGRPYCASALAAHRSVDELVAQAHAHQPSAVAICDDSLAEKLAYALRDAPTAIFAGPNGLCELVRRDDVNIVLSAIVGAAGLEPALASVRAGKRLALANKESLVVSGALLIEEAKKSGAEIIPVDSEHSAIFQALCCGRKHEVQRVMLTASGGPFRAASAEAIENATPADALKHPTWSMGSKITIDSASMFNKALEVIEACWLFDLPPERVEVVIHPESIIHSMVEFTDGSTIAQLSPPDMRTPIQYALTYPERRAGNSRRLDLGRAMTLTFEPPDLQRFPALRLGYEAATKKGTMGAVLNGANEVAVAAFLAGDIRFGMIWRAVEFTMQAHRHLPTPDLAELLTADRESREVAQEFIARQP